MDKTQLPPVKSVKSMSDIPLREARQYVYNTASVLGSKGWKPGSFTKHLIKAVLNADRQNYAKIKQVFPVVVWGVETFKHLSSEGLYEYGS
jgi:hypothetical protein